MHTSYANPTADGPVIKKPQSERTLPPRGLFRPLETSPMDLYLLTFNNGLQWRTTKYAHYISLFRLQLNIRRR